MVLELLKGKWQAYKFATDGVDTNYGKGKGILIQVHPDGVVDEAYCFQGSWSKRMGSMRVEERDGKTVMADKEREVYVVQHINQYELELGAFERYKEPRLVYYLKRVILKS